MSRQRQHKQLEKAVLKMLALIACVWLLPASMLMAASNGISVSVAVVDAIALDVNSTASEIDSSPQSCQIITEFVTQTASSPSGATALDKADGEQQAGDEIGLPIGKSSEYGIDDAVWGGIHITTTATRL
jgi:hypothetical protein